MMHLLFPGLGFLYAERLWHALFVPVFFFSFVLFIGWTRLILTPWGIWLIWAALIAMYILLVPWVFFAAKKQGYSSQSYRQQRWVHYFVFALMLTVTASMMFIYRAQLFGYEAFQLPSRSMANTLLPNDFIIVDTWAYDDEEPKTGDILVFKYPKDPKTYYTKRVIGKPGDIVEIRQGKVVLNGSVIDEPYVLAANNKKTAQSDITPKRVMKNFYYMLGDNRDFSNDSREWGGLAAEEIYGKAISIWFSLSPKGGIRFERIKALQ